MSRIGTTDFYARAALGLIDGVSAVPLVTGTNRSVGTSIVDISDFGNMVFPTAGETWEIVSADSNDTDGGTGCNSVVLIPMADDFTLQTPLVIDLNGGTKSVSGSNFRVRSFFCLTAGSGGTNAGNITLQVSGGGSVRARILAGAGESFNSFYTVPAGKTAQVLQTASFTSKGDDAEVRSQVRNNKITDASVNVGGSIPTYQSGVVFPIKTGIIPEKVDFWFKGVSSNTGVLVTTVAEIVEYDNVINGIDPDAQVISRM